MAHREASYRLIGTIHSPLCSEPKRKLTLLSSVHLHVEEQRQYNGNEYSKTKSLAGKLGDRHVRQNDPHPNGRICITRIRFCCGKSATHDANGHHDTGSRKQGLGANGKQALPAEREQEADHNREAVKSSSRQEKAEVPHFN